MSSQYSVPLALSFAIHFVLAAVLLLGDFATPIKPTPSAVPMEPIQAVVIEKSKVDAQVNKIKKQKADDAKKLKELEQRVAAANAKRLQEEKRIKKLERERRQKEQEKKAADQAAKKAKAKANAADKLRKQKELEQKQAAEAAAKAKAQRIKEEKAAKKAEQLRKKQEAERKRKAEEARERAAQQKLLEQQMAEEMASRQQARRQQVMTEIGRYTALITQTIKRNLITDRSTMEGKSCKLTISLAPSGFVTNVVTGQGDRIVCEAAKTAVYKAGTLPVSKDPEIFRQMKTISLTVAPDKFN
ncbi:Cell division and transport-associated protein TolA [Colwellia chukchiensis]|uniref:Cell division and transport-associated protein TolA n=1 Tax=Colwellia chukchiensis TaxID=641665 RepID=A0A1H7RU98_9GAMM|nr:cell envelope integrity protein TolA [Colwellia chukchiensis]SEL63745.1 Cell division and transport-associated protein TolA [Colwellia chukchiensis]